MCVFLDGMVFDFCFACYFVVDLVVVLRFLLVCVCLVVVVAFLLVFCVRRIYVFSSVSGIWCGGLIVLLFVNYCVSNGFLVWDCAIGGWRWIGVFFVVFCFLGCWVVSWC